MRIATEHDLNLMAINGLTRRIAELHAVYSEDMEENEKRRLTALIREYKTCRLMYKKSCLLNGNE